mmetsp:Transcript_18498/g.45532  ORF Transcript_18498/g.45532 Transcript_18498/m.45532 type:complete len:225 (+) Transcript_18498:1-675(+)
MSTLVGPAPRTAEVEVAQPPPDPSLTSANAVPSQPTFQGTSRRTSLPRTGSAFSSQLGAGNPGVVGIRPSPSHQDMSPSGFLWSGTSAMGSPPTTLLQNTLKTRYAGSTSYGGEPRLRPSPSCHTFGDTTVTKVASVPYVSEYSAKRERERMQPARLSSSPAEEVGFATSSDDACSPPTPPRGLPIARAETNLGRSQSLLSSSAPVSGELAERMNEANQMGRLG